MQCLLRRDYDAATLIRDHPPRLRHPHKQLVYELCNGVATTGPLSVTRWAAAVPPASATLAPLEAIAMAGYYDYAGDDRGMWHVNSADPQLFVAYGSALLAQDELQAAEHPVLGAIREALIAKGEPALTEVSGATTPVLVIGAERRCTIETAPDLDAGRPYGLYGNRFAAAPPDVVRRAVRVHQRCRRARGGIAVSVQGRDPVPRVRSRARGAREQGGEAHDRRCRDDAARGEPRGRRVRASQQARVDVQALRLTCRARCRRRSARCEQARRDH